MRSSWPWLALAALTACQEYQFSPVGRCVIQPGRASVTASAAAVDILFVVDDSVSMDGVQTSLGNNFGSFINRLAQKQQARVAEGKAPFDIHVAITSSSVLVNRHIAANGSCGRRTPDTCSIDTVTTPPDRSAYSYACTSGLCGDIVTSYYNYLGDNCTPGVLRANGDPFPAGSFLAAGSNPRVLSFSRDLDWARATTDPTIQGLMARFRQNVQVGSCGASQEMHLEAARLAIQKALAGQQGLPPGVGWPHAGSQLALVIVGNEDDCSTRRADQGGLVWDGRAPGQDTCYTASQRPSSELYPVSEYAAFLTGLGRPVVAAFVRPGYAGCGPTGETRMQKLGRALQDAGVRVIETSVCSDSFATALDSIASEIAPPDHLQLPTVPAADKVTQLRLIDADGASARVCEPGDWWFVDCDTEAALAAGQTSACIKLKQGGGCEPEPGQTLQAEYLGRVPESGCATDGECTAKLGGSVGEWSCVGAGGVQKGTCVCAGQ